MCPASCPARQECCPAGQECCPAGKECCPAGQYVVLQVKKAIDII